MGWFVAYICHIYLSIYIIFIKQAKEGRHEIVCQVMTVLGLFNVLYMQIYVCGRKMNIYFAQHYVWILSMSVGMNFICCNWHCTNPLNFKKAVCCTYLNLERLCYIWRWDWDSYGYLNVQCTMICAGLTNYFTLYPPLTNPININCL